MRKGIFAVAVVVVLVLASPAEACQECVERINPQSQLFCWECQYTNCGWFQCEVRQYSGWGDYCHNSEACFTYEGQSYCGPDQQGVLEPVKPLAETWRLVRARVQKQPGVTAGRTGRQG